MENNEESEISMEFGRVLRMTLGAAMQAKEAADRRAANRDPDAQNAPVAAAGRLAVEEGHGFTGFRENEFPANR